MKLRVANNHPDRKQILKQQYYQTPIKSMNKDNNNKLHIRQLKSTSRSKLKLRNYLLKNKYLVTQETYLSPSRKEMPAVSTFLKVNDSPYFSESHSQLKSQRNRLQKMKEKGTKNDNQLVKQSQKKKKREFKLIHQMKIEKAKKIKQKPAVLVQQSHIFFEQKQQLQFPGLKTMQFFSQQLSQVLQLNRKSDRVQPSKIQQQKQQHLIPKQLSIVKQNTKMFQIVKQLKQLGENTKESNTTGNNNHEQQQRKLDLNRSIMKVNEILQKRRESIGSDISIRQSKFRQEISLSLALYSRTDSKMNHSGYYKEFLEYKKKTTLDKLNIHISILKSLSNFVIQSINFNANSVQWQQLNFLIYKKYYIQRVKIVNFLKRYPMKNPFNICHAEISAKQIIQFMKKQQGKLFKSQMIKQTKQIKQKLLTIYNNFEKQKLGERINLFECDNFSNWLIQELWAELILTQYDAVHLKEEVNVRLCRLLQTIFLVSQLNGKYEFPFQQAETALDNKQYEKYIKQGKAAFEQYILYQNC